MKSKLSWSAFWARVGTVSIRTKIMGIVATSILVSALALAWYDYRDDRTTMRHNLQERGIAIGTGIAAQSRDLILTGDQFALYRLIRDTRDADKDLAYAFILDTTGNVLVHTFDGGFPADLLDKNEVPPGEPYHIQALQTENDTIQDVAVPVLGGKAGVVHLGMSESFINAAVAEHLHNVLIIVALILAFGLSVAYGLASILTAPVSRLAEAARAIGRGDFRWKSPIWAKDEIGSLGTAFNEMSEELKRKEEMRTHLLAKVISAQEEERKRIARELHDEFGQALTMIMMDLAQTRDILPDDAMEAKKRVSQSRSLAEQALTGLRKLIYELRPEVLDQLGLEAALRSYVKSRLQTEDIKVQFHLPDVHDQLTPEVETILFRVVQEAINNIVRHSRATMVEIEMVIKDSMVIASVRDNGIGFDVEEKLTNLESFGLLGIKERVAFVGGKLNIESEAGRGSCLKVNIPLGNV